MSFQLPNRQSIRMPGFDYRTPATYFISIVAHGRERLFGEIVNGVVHLSPLGQIVADEWQRTPIIRQEITLDEWVIMPDHFHAIVWINGRVETAGIVGAGGLHPMR